MNTTQHQDLLEQFRQLGGSERMMRALSSFSLQNYAKLKYEVKKLNPQNTNPQKSTGSTPPPKSEKPKQNKVFHDLIVDYPAPLHPIFLKRWEVWLSACSLKIQLNEIPEQETQKAFAIQWKIYQLFQEFDRCQKILKHYREHKRVMPTQTKKDFSTLSEVEIFKRRNNLRALITRRKQTIAQMEKALPPPDDENYAKRLHTLNLKREQLQEKINELITCDKLLTPKNRHCSAT